jgi:hypothetical protein
VSIDAVGVSTPASSASGVTVYEDAHEDHDVDDAEPDEWAGAVAFAGSEFADNGKRNVEIELERCAQAALRVIPDPTRRNAGAVTAQ